MGVHSGPRDPEVARAKAALGMAVRTGVGVEEARLALDTANLKFRMLEAKAAGVDVGAVCAEVA